MKKIIITGGLGFIGSNLINILKKKYFIINIDKVTYASNYKNIDPNIKNYKFYKEDINNKVFIKNDIVMPNSYRIRTQVGVDKSVRVLLEQDFEQLEILSLKILQNQIYTRQCSDYGVIVGRISANDGFGLPNCKVSVFIPLTSEDEGNPVISELYPYRTIATTNEDGFRYNLLPYVQSYSGHVPTGSFPDREDVLTDPSLIEVYNKYYKFTTQTNDSGDYMIFGVPVGVHAIHVDIDLSVIKSYKS